MASRLRLTSDKGAAPLGLPLIGNQMGMSLCLTVQSYNFLQGLAALLVQGLNGLSPEEIVRIHPGFIERLGLGQALTPSRNNGFLNMFKLMQAKALQLLSTQ